MTIDEAIKHAEEVAEEKEAQAWEAQLQEEYRTIKSCKDCAEEHRQLAGWLKELKQLREQEPCEDAVSRKSILNHIFYSTDNSGDVVLGSNLRKRIEELPPVTPTRKKGKWINKSYKGGCGITFGISECTCCGKYTFFDCDELLYRYCPNCGAEMEGEE